MDKRLLVAGWLCLTPLTLSAANLVTRSKASGPVVQGWLPVLTQSFGAISSQGLMDKEPASLIFLASPEVGLEQHPEVASRLVSLLIESKFPAETFAQLSVPQQALILAKAAKTAERQAAYDHKALAELLEAKAVKEPNFSLQHGAKAMALLREDLAYLTPASRKSLEAFAARAKKVRAERVAALNTTSRLIADQLMSGAVSTAGEILLQEFDGKWIMSDYPQEFASAAEAVQKRVDDLTLSIGPWTPDLLKETQTALDQLRPSISEAEHQKASSIIQAAQDKVIDNGKGPASVVMAAALQRYTEAGKLKVNAVVAVEKEFIAALDATPKTPALRTSIWRWAANEVYGADPVMEKLQHVKEKLRPRTNSAVLALASGSILHALIIRAPHSLATDIVFFLLAAGVVAYSIRSLARVYKLRKKSLRYIVLDKLRDELYEPAPI